MRSSNTHTDSNPEQITLEKPSILIVDDSAIMRKSMVKILCEDFNIVEANDGVEGWESLVRDHSIQVVIADLMMPHKNGFQLLREIRESVHERINQLPVIIITSHEDDDKMKRRAMSMGASDFISKPFDSIQIKARAKSYAKHGDTARKLEQTRKILAEKTTIDPLTGLANPRYFKQHGPELLAFAARQGTDVSVLRLDIDKFEVLVKKKGKQVGEKIILNVSKIINACVRKEDAVARIREAKFAVMMPGAGEAAAKALAQRIHQLINKSVYRMGETRFRMTASAGLVCGATCDGAKFDDVVKLAEERLSDAIKSGGAKLVLDDTVNAQRHNKIGQELPPRYMLTLDEAVVLLKAGQTDKVHAQLKPLMAKLFPLLTYANTQMRLGLDGSLVHIHERFKRINPDML